MQNIKPLKRFGQNYLTDNNILRKIAEEISPKPEDSLIEIGPGNGALTQYIIEKNPNLTAVEIDRRVIDDLHSRFPGLNLIQSDFLDFNLDELYSLLNKKIRIAGNIPYNLTSPIIFKLIKSNQCVEDAVFMVQLEVAKRMTAKKGTKDYGILAVLLSHFTQTKICFRVSPNVFYPKPKVESAVVHLYFKDNSLTGNEKEIFIRLIKAAFGKRRKTLKNSLGSSIFASVNFSGSNVDLSKRAEQLDTEDFIKLTKYFIENSDISKLIATREEFKNT